MCSDSDLENATSESTQTDSWYDEVLIPEERKEIMLVMAREVRTERVFVGVWGTF